MYEKIMKQFGSPLYVYDLNNITRSYEALKQALPKDSKLLYSVKCNNNNTVIKHLESLGSYFEVANVSEYKIVRDNDIEPHKILFTSPSKKYEEIYYAIKDGIKILSCESLTEFELINSICSSLNCHVDVVIRVNFPSKKLNSSFKMGGITSQFGIDLEVFLAEITSFVSSYVGISGIHTFYGSNMNNIEEIVCIVKEMIEISQKLEEEHDLKIKIINFGGGFPASYACNEDRVELGYLFEKLEAEFKRINLRNDKQLYFESGRYLLSNSGVLMGTVLYEKQSKGVNYLITDIGLHCLNGLSSSRRILPPKNEINFINNSCSRGDNVYQMVGPSCSPLDIINPNVKTKKKVKHGDQFYIKNLGAYGLSASIINFLSRSLPLELCIKEDELVSITKTSVIKEEVK